MKKLLHERLREYGSNCRADYTDWLSQRHANELADEIEKYYIPRPRFEDGEPVQFGDEVEGCNGKVGAVLIFPDGSGYVYGREDSPFSEPLGGAIIEGGLERPSDSLKKLRDDATIPQREYYRRLIGHDVGLKDDEEISVAVHNHIINRAIALIERGA